MRRQIPLALVFMFGIFMIFQYFVPHESSEWIYEFFLKWAIIIGIFALALGIWSLIRVSIDRIKTKKPNWVYSLITLAGLFLMMFFGFTGDGLENPMFRNFFNHILIPIQATMFALLAFFIASAAYRAFRARNVMASLLLVAALVVMLRFNPYLGPLGQYVADASSWLLNVPNLAAKRAIIIGIGLGIVATALKVILGIERGYMGKG
jgi:uncharacterized membrane protein